MSIRGNDEISRSSTSNRRSSDRPNSNARLAPYSQLRRAVRIAATPLAGLANLVVYLNKETLKTPLSYFIVTGLYISIALLTMNRPAACRQCASIPNNRHDSTNPSDGNGDIEIQERPRSTDELYQAITDTLNDNLNPEESTKIKLIQQFDRRLICLMKDADDVTEESRTLNVENRYKLATEDFKRINKKAGEVIETHRNLLRDIPQDLLLDLSDVLIPSEEESLYVQYLYHFNRKLRQLNELLNDSFAKDHETRFFLIDEAKEFIYHFKSNRSLIKTVSANPENYESLKCAFTLENSSNLKQPVLWNGHVFESASLATHFVNKIPDIESGSARGFQFPNTGEILTKLELTWPLL